jgi:hypothetical protein
MEIKIKGQTYRSEAELKGRVAALDLEHEGEPMPEEAREEWNALNERIDEFSARRERILELARTRRNLENGDGATFDHGRRASTIPKTRGYARPATSACVRSSATTTF